MDFLKSLGSRNQSRKTRDWFAIKNLASGEAEVFIYDFIGFDPWFGGVSAQDFVRDLRGITANKILLRINSPGGDITEAVTIRNALREHPAAIETHVDGLAASSASWLGLVAEKVVMSPHSMMMIHEPWNIIAGDSQAMAKEAEILDKFGDDIASMYVEQAGGEVEEWRDLMREETWYTDQEAVDAGLADEVAGEASGENRYDPTILNVFKHTPEHLLKPAKRNRTPKPTPIAAIAAPNEELLREVARFEHIQSRLLGVA